MDERYAVIDIAGKGLVIFSAQVSSFDVLFQKHPTDPPHLCM